MSKHVEMIIDYVVSGEDYQYNDNHGVLVRCIDCAHRSKSIFNSWYCLKNDICVAPRFFCGYGEGKDGGNNK